MSGILDGIKVLDLSRVIAGPMTTQNLADMGATVIKVERPGEGDDTRRIGPFYRVRDAAGNEVEADDSSGFLAYNRGKKSITLDISRPEGQEMVRQLADQCDVVMENYKVGTMARYGLDYDTLSKRNPRLVYCSISGFGQTGPLAKRAAYDFILQGYTGMMSTCGHADGEPGGGPMRTAVALTDVVTGLYATTAIVSALYHRLNTGEGQYIDMALMDGAMATNGHLAIGYLVGGVPQPRAGNGNPTGAPSGVFPAKDGSLIVAAGNNGQFQLLCKALGLDDMASDPRYTNNTERCLNRDTLHARITESLRDLTVEEAVNRIGAAGVPCGPVHTLDQAFAQEQIQHRGLALQLPHSRGFDVPSLRSPLRFSKTPVEHKAPPMLGEHTDEVLGEMLGLSPEQIRALESQGLV
ncbi:CoA transferase [Comamonas serinivorans]|uniref:CoA transferase n=1 Tax=Comamonas serinivorans TaxID=1082851 RepID=A0A1Y0EN70_9BURK|nr:CaiB/BaiF CoA-transferase family protein [Comamonas serinivorans]ARU04868.1 CoA transferase [Comamonas serinivorans]